MPVSTPLAGRVALVTGVSRRIGIGATLVRRLLADGACVSATGWRGFDEEMPWGPDPNGTEAVASEIQADPTAFEFFEADFEDPAAPDAAVARVVERFGRLDIVVANHARSSHEGFAEVSAEELDRCWAVNARASILLAQGLARRRAPGPGGRLVLFTSGQHIGPMSNELAYAVSKGAIHQMTASLADAVADQGITVNCLNPGPVDTGYATDEDRDAIARMFPAGRWGTPEDVARLVAWLVSDEAEWVTGQVLNSEGGFRRWRGPRMDRRHEA